MKGVISIIVIVAVLMIGCQENESILEPVNYDLEESLNKSPLLGPIDLGPDSEAIDIPADSKYTLIQKRMAKEYTFDGSVGGQIIQKYMWVSEEDTLKLEAYLDIPEGAYEGELTFEIVFDPNLLSMELHPTPFYFDKPVEFTMMYKGISEEIEVDPKKLDFKYFNPDGSFEEVDYRNVAWDPSERTLMVFGAELNHFSRYGWTRTGKLSSKDQIITE